MTGAWAHTPVERHGAYWYKRDDLFAWAGATGGKARALVGYLQAVQPAGITSACSRQSPQLERIPPIATAMGLPCRMHVPSGPVTPQMEYAKACGADIAQHKPGYNNVIIARARSDAEYSGWHYVPWGMDFQLAVDLVAEQVDNLPVGGTGEMQTGPLRIVVPVGSGITLAGILHGFERTPYAEHMPVLGVMVGKDPEPLLHRYVPPRLLRDVQLVRSTLPYANEAPAEYHVHNGVPLDPIYEAKCVPYLEPGDLLWCVGRRQEVVSAP